MRRRNMVAAASALLVAACFKPSSKADIAKQIRVNEARSNQAYALHDVAALASVYADDAALAYPGIPLALGSDAIQKATGAVATDRNLRVQFASDRIHVADAGDVAYSRGHYELTIIDPATNKAVNSGGHYLTVWRRQRDGAWKAVENFVTPATRVARQRHSARFP